MSSKDHRYSHHCAQTTKYFPTIPTKLTIVKNTESTAVKRIVVFFFIFNCSEKIMGRGVIFGRREGGWGRIHQSQSRIGKNPSPPHPFSHRLGKYYP